MRPPEVRTSSTLTTTAAMSAKAVSSGACQPAASASMLNAAPLLKASTRLKNPVTMRRSPGAKLSSTSHFVSWSATTMAADKPNQAAALRMHAPLAGAAQVAHAPGAQRLVVDVGPVVPAALAFAVGAGDHLDVHLARLADYARGGGQHDVLQVFPETCQQVVVGAVGLEFHLGLQRRADAAGAAQVLDALAHRIAQLAQALPARDKVGRVGNGGQRVPRLEEHAVVLLAR